MEIISTKIGYECPILKVEERLVKINGIEETHYVVIRQPNVTVLALDNEGNFVFIKQSRGKNNTVKLELPSGKLDKYDVTDEEAEDQGLIELREETGFVPKNIKLIKKDVVISSWFERDFYLYVAWDLENIGQKLEETESIEVQLIKPEDVYDRVDMKGLIPQEELLIEEAIKFFESMGRI